jgi:uncharacterized protein (TIGR02246 family)
LLSWLRKIFGIGDRSGKKSLFARKFEPSTHPLRPVFDEVYSQMRAAMASGDKKAIAALLTPDFVSVDVSGNEMKAEKMIESILALEIDRAKRVTATTITNVDARGDEAVLLQHYSMKSSPDAPRSMPRNLQTLSKDVWSNATGRWLMHRTETLEVEVVSGAGVHQFRSRE